MISHFERATSGGQSKWRNEERREERTKGKAQEVIRVSYKVRKRLASTERVDRHNFIEALFVDNEDNTRRGDIKKQKKKRRKVSYQSYVV